MAPRTTAGSPKTAREVRIACVGGGAWGKNLIRNFADLGALHSICETDGKRRAELASRYPDVRATADLDEVLGDPDVDAVAIATPAVTHGELARRALEADKDVFVEKPLSLSVELGERLVALAERRSRILMVGHLLWYHPAVRKLKELTDQGELGRIRYIYSQRLNFGRVRREENILWSFAPHDLSLILGLVGESPDRVQATGGYYLHEQVADVTVTAMTFPSGAAAHIFVSWLHPYKEQRLVVIGDRKMAVFNDLAQDDKLVLYPHAIEWRDQMPVLDPRDGETIAVKNVEPLRIECGEFLECVATRARPRTDGYEALSVLRVLQTCQQALDTERKARFAVLPAAPSPTPGAGVVVHPSAAIDEDVEIGPGSRIWHHVHVMAGARIGRSCVLGQNVFVGRGVVLGDGVKVQNNVSVFEGVKLEDHVFCGPSVVFTNVVNPRSEIERKQEFLPTLVCRGATLGANATIRCGTRIGEYAFVGAGAVVLRDVPDFALVVGNPGRVIGWMCACGRRIHFADDERGACESCGKRYHRAGDRVTPVA